MNEGNSELAELASESEQLGSLARRGASEQDVHYQEDRCGDGPMSH
jgi:hypothetical protein